MGSESFDPSHDDHRDIEWSMDVRRADEQGGSPAMKSTDVSARIALLLGGVAIIGMTAMTAGCSKDKDKPAETTSPTPSSSAPAPSSQAPASPTEKAPTLTPGGPNKFTPSVLAPPAPTALPGNVVTGG
jgi:hypothetical protein